MSIQSLGSTPTPLARPNLEVSQPQAQDDTARKNDPPDVTAIPPTAVTGLTTNLLGNGAALALQEGGNDKSNSNPSGNAPGSTLSESEEREVRDLSERDLEVRTHERAHQTAGGSLAGAASYDLESGPDNKQYAVSGEVPIDASPVSGDPQATIEKMEKVKQAALAPNEPSTQDRAVAAEADAAKLKAQAELVDETAARGAGGGTGPGQAPGGGVANVTSSDAPGGRFSLAV